MPVFKISDANSLVPWQAGILRWDNASVGRSTYCSTNEERDRAGEVDGIMKDQVGSLEIIL